MGWGRAQYLCFLLQRKLQGLDLVKLLAFECFLPAHPKPSSKQPRKTKQARQSPSACVAALWSRIYAPLPAPPSVNCLIVSGVQHRGVSGGQRELGAWIPGARRRPSDASTCLVDARPHSLCSSLGCCPTWLYCSRCGRGPFTTIALTSCLSTIYTYTHRDAPGRMPPQNDAALGGGK